MMLILCLFLTLLLPLFIVAYKLWWVPLHLQRLLKSQGITGPSYKFLHGSTGDIIKMRQQINDTSMELSHDIFPWVQPHLYSWLKLYGNNFVYWMGTRPQIVITEPELIKEIFVNREGKFPKPKMKGSRKKLFGDGIPRTQGEKWLKFRKLSNHAFHGESLKEMVPAMIASAETMLENWKDYLGKEIDVCSPFKFFTSDVISRTAFGSSYLEGRKIFDLLTKMTVLVSRNTYTIRFLGIDKFIRTKDEIEVDRMHKLLHDSIMEIVKKRQHEVETGQADSFGNDFLGSLLKNGVSAAEIIDQCKTFYFAGQDTTYSLLSWATLLLAIHTDWQEKARNEVFQFLGQEDPSQEGIARLKTVNNVLYETLRLYSPANALERSLDSRVRLGKYECPAGAHVEIPTLVLHRNPDIWGEDAHLFNPERFAKGLAKPTDDKSLSFLGFGVGPRSCVGSNFAINEAKIALSMILQRYRFTLSPNYVHSPFTLITLQPQHGVQILLQPLE